MWVCLTVWRGCVQRTSEAWVTKTATEARELHKQHQQQSKRREKKQMGFEAEMQQKWKQHLCLEASQRWTARHQRKESLVIACPIGAKTHCTALTLRLKNANKTTMVLEVLT
jgi:hypothetical protein